MNIEQKAALAYAEKEKSVSGSVKLRQASTVKVEPVTWLWGGYLALGKFHILGGSPGTGKTTISMSLAASVSNGSNWADGSRCEQGKVVIWSGEDDPADTLVPRLALCGANLDNIYFIEGIREGKECRAFDPSKDFEKLAIQLEQIGNVRLVIVDPIVSAVQGDGNKNAEVRRDLQPLVDMAIAMRFALLGITHFSKGTGGREPTERITGSLAFGALARIVLVAAKHQAANPEETAKRIFTRAKSNISPDGGGFEYDIEQGELESSPGVFSSLARWGVQLEGSARELLAEADAVVEPDGGAVADAINFLEEILAHGSMPSQEVKARGKAEGISERTLARARKTLGVQTDKSTFSGGTIWYMANREKSPSVPTNPICATQKVMAQMEKIGTNGNSIQSTGVAL